MTHACEKRHHEAERAKVDAGYAHVDTMVERASAIDGSGAPLWHGWALRDAFVAGAEWQEGRAAKADVELPELPDPPTAITDRGNSVSFGYTPTQMREFARAAVLAERDRLCSRIDDILVGVGTSKGDRDYIMERLKG